MRKIFYSLVLAGCVSFCYGQDYNDKNTVAVPSANNNFLHGGSGINVNLYAGVPQINIPIYNLPSKELTIPVSLSYVKAGGIKVQDVANFCGLGWQVNAGGSISRVVRSLPDEHAKGYIGTGQAGKTVMEAVRNSTTTGFPNALAEKISKGEIDGEPDLFNCSTPFFSFQFVFDENGNPVVSGNSNGIKIAHNLFNNTHYQFSEWTVTDDRGNRYYFGTYKENLSTKLFETDYTFISTWYLTKIVAFNNSDEINFDYSWGNNYNYKHYAKSQTVFTTTSGSCSPPSNPEEKDLTQTYTFNGPYYLSKIRSSLGEVVFNYQNDRQDLANTFQLTTITVFSYQQHSFSLFIKKFRFNYSYFGAPSSDPEALRLKLDNIQVSGGTDAAPIVTYKSFDYHTNVNLPARNSVEFDYSGFYNVNTSGTNMSYAGANKQPDANRSHANVLKAITDVSGAVDRIEYEMNTMWDNATGTNITMAGLRVKKISQELPSGETTYTEYQYNDAAGHSTGQVYKSNYNNFSRWVFHYSGMENNQICGIHGHNYLSESIMDGYEMNGPLVAYSSVKEIDQNGGYEISNFYNYSDFPDAMVFSDVPGGAQNRQLGAYTSLAYKRGLVTSKTTHKANGDMITEVVNTYNPLGSLIPKAYGVKSYPWVQVLLGGSGSTWWSKSYYNTNVEDFVLTKTVTKTYDQHSQSFYDESTTQYTYTQNARLIKSTTTTDSKGATRTETNYYPGDANIPNVTVEEQAAINSMIAANNINEEIHTTESVNGTAVHTHYSFKNFNDQWVKNIVLLTGTTSYMNNNTADWQVKKNEYQYDFNSLQTTSTSTNGDVSQSMLYGHNNSLVVAEATNAVNRSWVTVNQGTSNGEFNFYYGGTSPQSTPIKVEYTGNVTFSLTFDGYYPPNAFVDVRYVLTGLAGYYSDYLCISDDATCDAYTSVTLQNVPPGNYTLTVYRIDTEYSMDVNYIFGYTYPTLYGSVEYEKELFYEGFEEYWTGSDWIACAGRRSMGGDYTVPFMKPNNREYQVDYHYYEDGKWHAASKTYDDYMVLSEGLAIDEVRVYPKDARMKNYCYDPLVGMIGQVDENNRVTTYEYDALGRLAITRDQDGNITEKVCYTYAGQAENCSFYGNEAQTRLFTRYCGGDAVGSQVPFTVPANTFFSVFSQEEANRKAQGYLSFNGPGYANTHGSCTPIYWNEERVKYFYSQTCPANTIPEPYPATLSARSVYSVNSVAEANQMADAQIDSWGQEEANFRGGCAPTTVSVEYDMYNNIYDIRVLFHNVNTGEDFDFEMTSHGTLDPIPIGTYNVTVYDPSETYGGYIIQICNNYTDYGPPATLYDVHLDPNCNRIVIW